MYGIFDEGADEFTEAEAAEVFDTEEEARDNLCRYEEECSVHRCVSGVPRASCENCGSEFCECEDGFVSDEDLGVAGNRRIRRGS